MKVKRNRKFHKPLFNNHRLATTPKPTHSKFYFLLAVMLFILMVLVVAILIRSNFLAATKIEIAMEKVICIDKTTLIRESNLYGKNLLFLNLKKIEQNLTLKYPCLKGVKLSKKYPSSVLIEVSPREAILAIYALESPLSVSERFKDASASAILQEATASPALFSTLNFDTKESSISGKFLVDKEGIIFASAEGDVAQQVIFGEFGNLGIGSSVNPKMLEQISLTTKRLQEMSLEIKKIKTIEQRLLLAVLSDLENSRELRVALSLEKDILRQVASLQLILTKARIDSRPIESVDLRFDKPVVVYSLKKK